MVVVVKRRETTARSQRDRYILPPQEEGGTAISRNSVMPGYLTGLQQSCGFELTFVLPTKPTNCLYFSVLAVLNGCKVVYIFTSSLYVLVSLGINERKNLWIDTEI